MDPLTALFVSLACKDLPLVEYAVEFTVLDRGKLPPPPRPPRHYWTEQEGSYHPVSGERLSQIQSSARPIAQPTITPMCGAQARAPTTDKPSQHGATELRIATELEWFMTSDQVRELATMPTTRETAVDSESAERSSAHCTMAEGELIEDLELRVCGFICRPAPSPPSFVRAFCQSCPHVKPREAAIPTSDPGKATVPESNPEMVPISTSSPEKDYVPELRPERASVTESSPEGASIPKSGPERASDPEGGPKRALVREYGPERASVPMLGPKRTSVPEFGPERVSVTKIAPERASVTEFSPEMAPVPELGSERALVPEFGLERAPVPKSSPKRARNPEPNTERASVPKFGTGRTFAPDCSHESPEAKKCPPTLSLASTAVTWQPLCSPSDHDLFRCPASLHQIFSINTN